MNCLGKIGKIFLTFLNALTTACGIALVAVAAYLYSQSGLLDDDIIVLLEVIGAGTYTLGDLLRIVCTIIIIVGVIIIIVSVLGVVGAVFEFRPVLFVYAVIVVILIILELYVINAWFEFKRELNATIKKSLLDALKTFKGFTLSTNLNLITIAWNLLFLLLDCCGVNAYSNVNDFQSTDWWSDPSRGSDVISGYCCKDATILNGFQKNGTNCTTTPTSENAHINTGCYDAIDNFLSSYSNTFISVCFIIIVIEATAVVCAIIMIWQITKDIQKKSFRKGKIHALPSDSRNTGIPMNERHQPVTVTVITGAKYSEGDHQVVTQPSLHNHEVNAGGWTGRTIDPYGGEGRDNLSSNEDKGQSSSQWTNETLKIEVKGQKSSQTIDESQESDTHQDSRPKTAGTFSVKM